MRNGFVDSVNGRLRAAVLNETLVRNRAHAHAHAHARDMIAARVTDYNATRPLTAKPRQASPCTLPPQPPVPLHALTVPRAGRLLNPRQQA